MRKWHDRAKILHLVLLNARDFIRGARATWRDRAKHYFLPCFHASSKIVARSTHAKGHDRAKAALLRAIEMPFLHLCEGCALGFSLAFRLGF